MSFVSDLNGKPDYDKINLLKGIQGNLRKTNNFVELRKGYKSALHDLELLKKSKYLSEQEFNEELEKLKNNFILFAMDCSY